MPSLIDPSLTNSQVNVAANYLKAIPSTQFGTRRLSVITITKAGMTADGGEELVADSLYSKIVRALQQTAEVWAIFTPISGSDDYFNAIIATHTQWAGDAASAQQGNTGVDGTGFGILETALNTGAGTTGIVVTVPAGFGQVAA